MSIALKEWLKSLRREDDLLIGEMDLSFLGNSNKVEICFIQDNDCPSLSQIDTLAGYIKDLDKFHCVSAKAIFDAYKESNDLYRGAFIEWGENPDEFAPIVSQKQELESLVIYQSLFIQASESPGEFGMGFWCRWDQEHGFGIKFVDWCINDIGENSIHFQ